MSSEAPGRPGEDSSSPPQPFPAALAGEPRLELPFHVYDALLWAAAPLLSAAIAAAAIGDRRLGRTWKGQLGLELPGERVTLDSIWLQAASVGETQAARPIIAALKEELPSTPIVLTGSTPEGLRLARERGGADHVATFPFDYRPILTRYFRAFEPRVCAVVETEIWPNLIRACRERGVPLVMVNGRISPRTMVRYERLAWCYRAFLAHFTAFLMQTDADAERIVRMGADAARVRVTGDTKYDGLLAASPPRPPDCPPGRYVVAGSTHPGETEQLLEVYTRLRVRHAELGLVLAPRHPETAPGAIAKAQELGLPMGLRSRGASPAPSGVLLLDTVGELAAFYGIAAVAFVGGSLVDVGGHSLLEPAAAGKPVLYGPHVFNFDDAAELLQGAGGGIRVTDAAALEQELDRLLAAPELAAGLGAAAKGALLSRAGAAKRIADYLRELMSAPATR
ncbi:MAG: 3-deoxy-D-manno-octulosonic acid transferase [Candidatus Wallbacteria bacterium]|nr:3-deoxy-D-manno-octulosonic acid transferase [Candidatus Wallbacteria bacterium]